MITLYIQTDYEVPLTAVLNVDDDESREEKVFDEYFASLQGRLSREVARSPNKLPNCYESGTFWVAPRNAALYLRKKTNPDKLYLPRVFVWMVHTLVDKVPCPDCDARMNSNG